MRSWLTTSKVFLHQSLDVDQGVVQRRAVVAGEAVALAEGAGGEDIRRDDLVEQAGEFGVGEADAVEGLELLAEVLSPAPRGRGCPW
jgi:hypothetical protein